LRPGDVILTVGGWPTSSVRHSAAVLWAAGIGESVSVIAERDGTARLYAIVMVVAPALARLHRLEPLLIALCFAFLGFAVWAHKPYDRTVVMFLLSMYSIAVCLAVGSLVSLHITPFAFLGFIVLLERHFGGQRALTSSSLDRGACGAERQLWRSLYALALIPPALYLRASARSCDISGTSCR
jgi:hypothetical protein